MKLICNECGNHEIEPYDIGDECYMACGGYFVKHDVLVEEKPKLCKMDDVFYDEGQDEKDRVFRGTHPVDMSTQDLIKIKCDECKELLLEKNREYGDSALHPLGIFSRLDAIEAIKIRIDDKLARIRYGGQKNIKEDTVLDLIGYLILLRVCEAATGVE